MMDDGTATYYLSKDYMRIAMKKSDLLYTRQETEKAWKRARSVKRNDPNFGKKKKKSVVPELYR
jgi:hypothetical protein